MDHLPLPNSTDQHFQVPFLEGIPYDNQGFLGYDTRQGWNIENLRHGNIRGARSEWNAYSEAVLGNHPDVASISNGNLVELLVGPFVQNWIFYGLFNTVLERTISPEEGYVEENGSGGSSTSKYLTTKPLFRELVLRKDDLATHDTWIEIRSGCLQHASSILQDLDALSDELGGFVIPGPTNLALSSLVEVMGEHLLMWFPSRLAQTTASISRTRWLEHNLSTQGWCPFRVKMLRTDLGISGLYYASIMSYPDLKADHSRCTEQVCIAHNVIDDSSFIQTHRHLLCRCKKDSCLHKSEECPCKAASKQHDLAACVSEIVLRGEIPLISIEKKNDSLKFNAKAFREGIKFTAISHVWSDGMGNPWANEIPCCQAEHLQLCIASISKSSGHSDVPIWIDTLCVPLTPKSARNAAIRTMHKVYSAASVVLVLTQELENCPLPPTTDETLLRIAQSKWMTRLWTMQEGILAKELAFQFQDRAIHYEYLSDQHTQSFLGATDASHMFSSKADRMISSSLTFSKESESRMDRLRSLWFAIRHRTTSKAKDQAICIAILCDLDVSPILAGSGVDPMIAFWREFEEIPLSILWTNGPRFLVDSMRWAPQSLLDPSTWAIPPSRTSDAALVSSKGLRFSGVEAIAFPGIGHPKHDDSLIEFSVEQSNDVFHGALAKNVGNPSWSEIAEHWSNIALLWDKRSEYQGFFGGVLVSIISGIPSLIQPEVTDAAVVSQGNNHILTARWLAQLTILPAGDEFDDMFQHFPTRFTDGGSPIREQLDILVHPSSVQHIHKDQQWCLV